MRYGILLIAILFSLSSCAPTHKVRVQYRSLDVEAFEKYIARENVLLVDVRTAEEHSAGYIEGTMLQIDVKKSDFDSLAVAHIKKASTVALYCRSGKRSKRAASALTAKGYQVIELASGYNGWVQAGKEVE